MDLDPVIKKKTDLHIKPLNSGSVPWHAGLVKVGIVEVRTQCVQTAGCFNNSLCPSVCTSVCLPVRHEHFAF